MCKVTCVCVYTEILRLFYSTKKPHYFTTNCSQERLYIPCTEKHCTDWVLMTFRSETSGSQGRIWWRKSLVALITERLPACSKAKCDSSSLFSHSQLDALGLCCAMCTSVRRNGCGGLDKLLRTAVMARECWHKYRYDTCYEGKRKKKSYNVFDKSVKWL